MNIPEETHTWHGCVHGYDTKINDKCPTCGSRSLFIGRSGWLTCGVIGCKEPGVSTAILHLKDRLTQAYKDGMLRASDIAEAIDSNRGNEAEIVKAIRAEAEGGRGE